MKKIYLLMVALFLVNGVNSQGWQLIDSLPLPSYPSSTNLKSVFFTDATTGYVAGEGGGSTFILKTTDSGENWTLQDLTYNLIRSIFFTDNNTGYAAGDCYLPSPNENNILKTTDGGMNWIHHSLGTTASINSIYFPSPDTGFAVGGFFMGSAAPVILKTVNGGINWTIVHQDSNVYASYVSVHFVNSNVGYVLKTPGGGPMTRHILKTINGGTSWQEMILDTLSYNEYTSMFFINENKGFIVGYDGRMKRTIDGGLNWIDQSNSSYGNLNSIFFPNEYTGYAVGGGYYTCAIIKTIDGGDNWVSQTSTTYSDNLYSVFFIDENCGYAAGYYGTIIKTTNGGGYPVGINDHNQTAKTLDIHPNPTSAIITVETPAKGSLSIHNTNGQAILQQETTDLSTTIDVSGWKSGVYVVKVVGEMGVSVGKFVKH